MLGHVHFLAVAIAALTSFGIGGVWYSASLFGRVWGRESGHIARIDKKRHHPAFVFVVSYLLAFIAAFTVAQLLGPHPGLPHALRRSVFIGFGFVATSFGINYLFGNRSMKLWLIDAGYHMVQFALFGVVLGLMA